jgi:hypothetical protein
VFVICFLNQLSRVLHYYPFEAAEVDGELLMRELEFLDDFLNLLEGDFLGHPREAGC